MRSAASEPPWINRLIYGDNLLAMAALLAGDEHTPSLRGKVDFIYIDPPFDSKADYRTKITLPPLPGAVGETELEQKPTVIEQFAYSDTWAAGTESYLAIVTAGTCGIVSNTTDMHIETALDFISQPRPIHCVLTR